MPYPVLSTRVIYTGRIFSVRSDRVQLPDGGSTTLDIVEHGGAVVIVPRESDGSFVMIRQYRHAAGSTLLEFPAGTLEPGEDPAHCAQRELREETGYAAAELTGLGGVFLAPGYSTEYLHVYLAAGLTVDPLPHDADELLEVVHMTPAALEAAVRSGQLQDAKTLAAYYLAMARLSGDA